MGFQGSPLVLQFCSQHTRDLKADKHSSPLRPTSRLCDYEEPADYCQLAAPQATPHWALWCVPLMTALERRKGSFITALPERQPEASEITMESLGESQVGS